MVKMARDIFNRKRLRSEAARRVYERAFGPQDKTEEEEEEQSKYKLLMEKRRKFNFWLLRSGKGQEDLTEEKLHEFEERRSPDYGTINSPEDEEEQQDPAAASAAPAAPSTIETRLDPAHEISKDYEETGADEEPGEKKKDTPSPAKPGSGDDFLEDLKKQYASPGAGSADEEPSELQDRAAATTQQIPSFAKRGQAALTSRVPQVSLEEFLTYFRDYGIVGEEKNLLRFGFRLSQLKPTFIDGSAGSGKTYIIKAALSLLSEDYYMTVDCASNTALYINEAEVEKHPIIWFKEFQKVAYKSGGNNEIMEMIKSWAEGEDAKRSVNDHGKLKLQKISERCVISCIATENSKKRKFDKDKETLRRFDILHTDESQEHIKAVREYKANLRTMTQTPKELSTLESDQVKRHFKELVDMNSGNQLKTFDPFANVIDEYLPETPRSVSYIDMYTQYVDGCAKFNYKNRLGENGLILVDLEDQFVVYRIYHKEFCDTLQRLDDMSDEDFDKHARRSKQPVDWRAVFDAGYEKIKERFSEEVAEEWVARQLTDKKVTVWDPILKKDVVIVDYDNPAPSSQSPKQYQHQALPSDQGEQYQPGQDTGQDPTDPNPLAYTPKVEPDNLDTEVGGDINIDPVDEISLDE